MGRRRSFCCLYGHDIHYFEDDTNLKGLNFVEIKFRGLLDKITILSPREKCAIPVI